MLSTMLTPEEITDLRSSFERIQRRPMIGPSGWDVCIGGPLDGLRTRKCKALVGPTASWSFGMVTYDGYVCASYCHGDKPGEWEFWGWESPGRRESGMLESGLSVASVGKQQ